MLVSLLYAALFPLLVMAELWLCCWLASPPLPPVAVLRLLLLLLPELLTPLLEVELPELLTPLELLDLPPVAFAPLLDDAPLLLLELDDELELEFDEVGLLDGGGVVWHWNSRSPVL